MAKDPAFLFYPNDFTSGTRFFTDEQVGKYIRLLCAQFDIGHLNEKDMLKICGTYDNDVFSKFIKDSDGLYYNERLEEESVKRKKYSESRSKNRSSKTIISSTYVPHMENENVTTTNITNGVVEKQNLSNLAFFLQSTIYQEKAIKAAKVNGLIFNFDQIKKEADNHDSTFLKFKNPTFEEWMQYFVYYLEKLKKNPPPNNPKKMSTPL